MKEDTYDGSLSKISSQVQAKSVMWDVVDVESDVLAQGCQEGLLEKLDVAKVGDKKDYMAAAAEQTCGVGYLAGAMTLAYDGASSPRVRRAGRTSGTSRNFRASAASGSTRNGRWNSRC